MRAELEHSANLSLDDPNPSVARRSEPCRLKRVGDLRLIRQLGSGFHCNACPFCLGEEGGCLGPLPCAGLGAKRFVGRALSRPWCARAERTRREARRSWLRMPTIASPHPPNAEQEQEACAERNQAGGLGNADDGDNPISSSRAVASPKGPGSVWMP
jgi:hypothetical protein